ncbi:MAG: hypothetical protein IPM63_13820 [Acidobacteriota bacterium]|nr:MAG: hypothetical protein IPM63_13820 [Acidobacteriota bacterium]
MKSILSSSPVRFFVFASFLFLFSTAASGAVLGSREQSNQQFEDPEKLVRELYAQLTFPAGKTPDWKYVRSMFINDATVTLRTGRDSTTTFSLDGWILDFVNFINDRDVKKTGFEEKLVKMRPMIYGDIAHVLVLYTAYLPGVTKEPQEGVDSFHLIKKDGRWWIVSILNEIPTKDRPKPDALN